MQAQVGCLHPLEVVCDGWIHAFGTYYPRRNATEHHNSDWSRAVILAKRKYEGVINEFGRMIAEHLEPLLLDAGVHVITHVPAESGGQRYLFEGLDRCATEILAECIHANMPGRKDVTRETLLVQVRPKARKQRQCENTAERIANVRGIYKVVNAALVKGQNIILVDDVMTSGATMNECAKVLRNEGALSVLGVALARTVKLKDHLYENTQGIGA